MRRKTFSWPLFDAYVVALMIDLLETPLRRLVENAKRSGATSYDCEDVPQWLEQGRQLAHHYWEKVLDSEIGRS